MRPPQQSSFVRQRSPVLWQPLTGWQMVTPVSAYGAQSRLQHVLHPLQTVPSIPPLQNEGPLGAAPHVPRVLPCATLHVPLQQSALVLQTSPG